MALIINKHKFWYKLNEASKVNTKSKLESEMFIKQCSVKTFEYEFMLGKTGI